MHKNTNSFRILACVFTLSLTLTGSVQAFNLGALKEKANGALSSSESGSELLSLGNSLYKAFKGNETATQYAKDLMGSLQAGKYGKVFGYYDQIKSLKLTPEQLSAWNEIKNPLSAFVLEQNFDFGTSDLTALVSKATEALKENQVGDAGNYLTKLKKAATLSQEQSALLHSIQENLRPLLNKQ